MQVEAGRGTFFYSAGFDEDEGVTAMIIRNALIALVSAVAGALLTFTVIDQSGQVVSSKSNRLDGLSTETAFLPERFGVPASAQ
jgi:hypothetical protein